MFTPASLPSPGDAAQVTAPGNFHYFSTFRIHSKEFKQISNIRRNCENSQLLLRTGLTQVDISDPVESLRQQNLLPLGVLGLFP